MVLDTSFRIKRWYGYSSFFLFCYCFTYMSFSIYFALYMFLSIFLSVCLSISLLTFLVFFQFLLLLLLLPPCPELWASCDPHESSFRPFVSSSSSRPDGSGPSCGSTTTSSRFSVWKKKCFNEWTIIWIFRFCLQFK